MKKQKIRGSEVVVPNSLATQTQGPELGLKHPSKKHPCVPCNPIITKEEASLAQQCSQASELQIHGGNMAVVAKWTHLGGGYASQELPPADWPMDVFW